jgi:hypothetical protein
MTTRFCYHCRLHHPESEMRQINTKDFKRWRCIKSIEATRQGREAREAFGRTVTEINKAASASTQRIQQAAKEARSGL